MKFLNFLKWKKKPNLINRSNNLEPVLISHADLFSLSNVGIDRHINEDYTNSGMNEFNDKLIIVCDGLGGYKGGKQASEILGKRIVINFLKTNFKVLTVHKVREWFVNTINEAKFEINRFVHDNPDCSKMSSTLVMAIITNKKIFGFNIGDSRLYGVKDKEVIQISKDHNYLNYLIDNQKSEKEINAEGIQIYAIVNYVGQFDETELTYDFFDLNKTDFKWVFVTSDGVHNFISLSDFKRLILLDQPIHTIAENIINHSLSGMSNDNLSIALAHVTK